MDYPTAKMLLANAVAADPFIMERFRKFGFWAAVTIRAAAKNKPRMAKRAFTRMYNMEPEVDIFGDITNVLPTIYFAARKAAFKF